MRKSIIAAAMAAALVGTSASAALVDGGFETQGAQAGDSYCYLGATNPFPCSGTGAWSGNGSGFINENNGAWPGVQTDGTYHAFVQGGGVLSQTFVADASGVYNLTFNDAGRSASGFNGPHTYNVLLDGARIFNNTTMFTVPNGFTARRTANFALTAGQSYTLSFSGVNTGDTTSFFDDVTLAAAAPEPAAWATMLGGFALAGTSLRRRRKLALA